MSPTGQDALGKGRASVARLGREIGRRAHGARLPGVDRLFAGGAGADAGVRVAADETLEVTFTVNGREARVRVAPRVTLADALRDHLGLTGTHLGCEHGVCGMCTVLVDGDAARACLLLAVQVDGSEILTVEGLGTPDDLHPLQESFGRHHALQCGFCTPGQLLSAYDLLDHRAGVDRADIAEEMSGVLCRCTGYRNIVDAIADVAQAHPEGVPRAQACGGGPLPARAHLGGTGTAGSVEQDDSDGPVDIAPPTGDPTVHIDVTESVTASPDQVAAVLADTETLARCLPGAELVADHGEDRYRGRVSVSLGPVRLAFVGDIHVVERSADGRSLRALAKARDAGGGDVLAQVALVAEPAGEGSDVVPREHGSVLHATADLHLTGRIAQFGRSLAADVSADMFRQFARGIDAVARGENPPADVAPPSALRMAAQVLGTRVAAVRRRFTTKGNT